jgi:hypothetical protein
VRGIGPRAAALHRKVCTEHWQPILDRIAVLGLLDKASVRANTLANAGHLSPYRKGVEPTLFDVHPSNLREVRFAATSFRCYLS